MDTYTTLRHFADSWALMAMVLFFLGIVVWVFRPNASKIYNDTAEIPFRHEDKPMQSMESEQ